MRSDVWMAAVTASACTAVVVSFVTFGAQALANLDDDDATDTLPRVVPYEGVLDLDGDPYTGFLDMRFTFYDAATGGNAVWTESWTRAEDRAVQLFSGRFAANLGTYDDGGLRGLEDVIADAGPTYLAIEVKRTDEAEDDWVALGGRQRLNPVPYAMWSSKASDLDVAGDLAVAGAATVAGAAAVGGNLAVAGSEVTVGTNDGRSTGADARQVALYHASDDSDALVINWSGTFEGGVRMHSALSLTGNLTVTGNFYDDNSDVTIDDGLIVTGSVSDSNGDVVINDGLDVVGITDLQGNLFDSNSDLTIDDALILTGSLSDSDSDVTINDGLIVTGNISDNTGDVVIADGLDITGADVDIRGNVFDGDSDALTISDGLTVTGDISLSDCRICINTKHDDGGDQNHACTRLVAGSNSGWRGWNVDINENDQFGLSFLCDGGGNSQGGSNVGM